MRFSRYGICIVTSESRRARFATISQHEIQGIRGNGGNRVSRGAESRSPRPSAAPKLPSLIHYQALAPDSAAYRESSLTRARGPGRTERG